MWTLTTRVQHSRCATRYQTDLTENEWQLVQPMLPEPYGTGRPRKWAMREIVNTILRSTRGHCLALVAVGSAALADSLRLVFALSRSAPFEKINHVLVMADPERVGREASPTAAIIDSQSVKTTERGGPRGHCNLNCARLRIGL